MSSVLSVNRILANHTNVLREAVIAATAQRPAGPPRLVAQSRQGRGAMAITGAYTGAADSAIEVELIDGAGSQLRTGTPVIAGVGNGTLEVTAVDAGAQPETVVFRLADKGNPASRARLEFFGVTLMARQAGDSGNALTLTVERNLTLGEPVGATLSTLAEGTSDLPDARWSFGATSGSGSGIPEDAPRLVFGGYPGVYRHWRTWKEGRWFYKLDPALPYEIPLNTPVHHVTGDYTLTLSDGTVTETYRAVTHYDFLSAVQARSALVEVVGLVARDTAPGGQAVTDIQLRTDAHALPPITNIRGTAGAQQLVDLTVAPDAVTENVTLKCRANTGAAAARWAVTGGASGQLMDAITGVPYDDGPVSFTIPYVAPEITTSPIRSKVTLLPRTENEPLPSVCIRVRPGAAAVPKTVTFVYTRRPPKGCDCTKLPMPEPNPACLGVDNTGGGAMALDPEYLTRLQALYDWRATFQGDQVDFANPQAARWAARDMDLANRAVALFAGTLEQVYTSADARAGWDAELTRLKAEFGPMGGVGHVAPDNIAIGTEVGTLARHPLNGRTYQLARVQKVETVKATTDPGSGPNTISAGMWVNGVGRNPVDGFLYRLDKVQKTTTVTKLIQSGTFKFSPPLSSGVYTFEPDGSDDQVVGPTTSSDSLDKLPSAPTQFSGWTSTHATSSESNNTDYQAHYGVINSYNQATGTRETITTRTTTTITWVRTDESTAAPSVFGFDLPALTVQPDLTGNWKTTSGAQFTLTTVGAIGAATDPGGNPGPGPTPAPGQPETRTSEVSTWVCKGLPPDLSADVPVDELARRYSARMDAILTLAGIVPKSDASSRGGDGCWRDKESEQFYWADEDDFYFPAFNNSAYVSSAKGCGVLAPDGVAYSTREFGFGLAIDCVGALKLGDRFTITINGGTKGPYEKDDTFVIPIIGAAPAQFGGGAPGSAVQTWAVSGSAGGAYPDWLLDPSAPAPYTAGPLDATLTPGGIPFEVNDQISVALEGGRLRWRRDAGGWTEGDLYALAGHALGDGLTLNAVPGALPSFRVGDHWRFFAEATWGVERLRQPREGRAFAFDGAAEQLTIDLGAVQPLECVLLALHSLPPGSRITLSGGLTATDDWSQPLDWRAGPILAVLPANTTARHLRLSISGAGTGAAIGWIWAGVPWAPLVGASTIQHIRQYGLTHGAGRNPSAIYSGRGTGGRWGWNLDAQAALLPDDVAALTALLDHVAEQELEWVCLLPDVRRLELATLAQIDTDAVTLTEELGYTLAAAALTSVDLPFRAVLG